jgi:crotonobetainyl-CoA:carnitine CoA-transferase CaiB-like acyl-CoA transferase
MVKHNMVRPAQGFAEGEVAVTGNPVKFLGMPEKRTASDPAVGEHTAEALGEVLGFTSAGVDRLAESGAVTVPRQPVVP